MLQALLQAELQAQLDALLRAEFYPPWRRGDGGGSLDPHKSQRNPEAKNVSRPRGSGLGREGCGERPRGRRGSRQQNAKPRVEYWHELLAYVDEAYRRKFGRHYPWNNLVRANLRNLARGYSAWEVMALWDLYLDSDSWWALKTGWSVYGLIRDVGRLMDDRRLKAYARQHEENLAKCRIGKRIETTDVFASLFQRNACLLPPGKDTCMTNRI
jgi:hypothetical protein